MTDIEKIKEALPVEQLVGEYVPLKRMGKYLKACCPFHNEKTPSFIVNTDRNNWHCFGCSKGGDIFTFVQDIDGLDFPEALRLLAGKAGVELTNTVRNQAESSQKNRIKDINVEAARFFFGVLTKMPAGKEAMAYLVDRGVSRETIDAWQIGFAADQWDLLTKYLLKKGHSIDDIIAAGLTIKREGANARTGRGFYDRFRGRVMFPIKDVHGAVVGFTGRVLVETDKTGAKYVNTPQTPVYDKSRVIFGLDRAKGEIRSTKKTVLVEGQMDVIACHQAGMTNVVATSGTAMTEQQVTLLKRYGDTFLMAFDGDAAGQKAAKRGIDIALAQGLAVRVIQIPDGAGKDPDECLKQNKNVWFKAVDDAVDIMQWYLDTAFVGKDITSPRDKQDVANTVLPEIGRLPAAVERDHWLRELSGRLGVDVEVLKEDMARLKKGEPSVPTPVPHSEPKKAENIPKTRVETLLELLLSLLLEEPQLLGRVTVNDQWFAASADAPLYEMVKLAYSEGKSDLSPNAESVARVETLLMLSPHHFGEVTPEQRAEEAMKLAASVHDIWLRERRAIFQQQIAQAESTNDTERLKSLLEAYQALL